LGDEAIQFLFLPGLPRRFAPRNDGGAFIRIPHLYARPVLATTMPANGVNDIVEFDRAASSPAVPVGAAAAAESLPLPKIASYSSY
jgi:hypothetical protein